MTPEHPTRLRIPGSEPGVEIAVLDFGGSGPPALLHHANGFCAAIWAPVAERLRQRFRVFAMDARGHGDSDRPQGVDRYHWSHFGADLRCVAEAVAGDAGRIALGLGHSFGGTSFALAAIDRPELFERLVLVDPILAPSGAAARARKGRGNLLADGARQRRAVWESREEAAAKWTGKEMFENWTPRAFELYLAEGMRDRPDGRVELKCAPEVEASVFENGPNVDVIAEAHRIRCPVLILWAERGDFPRAHYEALAARMPDAAVRDAPTGHLVAMEAPEWLADEVLAQVP